MSDRDSNSFLWFLAGLEDHAEGQVGDGIVTATGAKKAGSAGAAPNDHFISCP